jgi:hypothetical protein
LLGFLGSTWSKWLHDGHRFHSFGSFAEHDSRFVHGLVEGIWCTDSALLLALGGHPEIALSCNRLPSVLGHKIGSPGFYPSLDD